MAVGNRSNSGVKAGVSSFSWNHTVASNDNRILWVGVMMRDGSLADIGIASITFNGDALSEIITREGAFHAGNFGVEMWGILMPDVGTFSIAVTLDGTCDHAGGFAIDAYDMNQSLTPEDMDSGLTNNFDTNDPSISLTTGVDNCLMIDFGYNATSFGSLTVGAGQTEISGAQLALNGGGDTGAASYETLASAGAGTMSWTTPGVGAGMDAWVFVAAAWAPAPSTTKKQMTTVGAG